MVEHRSMTQRAVGVIALSCLALLGNWLSVPLFFGVDLIFGSVAVMLAIVWLGVWSAAVVAFIGALYTLVLWGQPFAIPAFVLEALLVGWLYHHRKLKQLVLADLAYWVLVGMPVVVFLYAVVLNMPLSAVGLIALKQAVNGVFNALLAGWILLLVTWWRQRTGSLSLSAIVFHSVLSAILIAGMTPILLDARNQRQQHESMMAERLMGIATVMSGRVAADAEADQRIDYHLSRMQAMFPLTTVALIKPDDGIPVTAPGRDLSSLAQPFDSLQSSSQSGLNIWLPQGSFSAVARWRAGYYWIELPIVEMPGYAVLVEQSAAGLVERMEKKRLSNFALLAIIFLLAIVLASLINRLLARSIRRLAVAGQSIARDVLQGNIRPLAPHPIVEFDQLSAALNNMGEELAGSVRVLHDAHGKLQQSVASRTGELAQANGLLNSVLNAAEDFSLIATDADGLITLFNAGAERMLGYSATELVGKETPALLHDASEVERVGNELSVRFGRDISGFKVFVAEAEQGIRSPREWTYITKAGERLVVHLVVTVIRGAKGDITGYLGIAEDITERKQLEQIKSEFISTVSHELRTPLTSIAGALGLLKAGALGGLPDQAVAMVTLAHNNSQRLTVLINDLLDIEKLAAGKLNFDMQWVDLPEQLGQAVADLATYASDQSVQLVLAADVPAVMVHVDIQRFQQVMANLLSNAIKFSPRQASVHVEVTRMDERVRISVSDQGNGVPEAFRSRIFQRFAQADASDQREKGGTGLGLAISKELVEAMGGQIGFDSTPGQGAVFWIELPFRG